MKTARLLPVLLLGLLTTGCVVAPVGGEVATDGYYGDTRVQVRVSTYPDLVLVPDSPVYYAPTVSANYFFYDGMYWVFQGDDWYASYWYNGPWDYVRIDYVPVFILRVPVYYYRRPPTYFRPWQRQEPPRWGERWGRDWEARHPDWRRRDGAMPAPAPRPDYQRNYGGRRYPTPDEQRRLRERFYPHQTRERVEPARDGRPQPPAQQSPSSQQPWQQRQEQWQQRRQEQQEQERLERQQQQLQRQQQLDDERRQREADRQQMRDEREQRRDDARAAQRQEQYERWRQRQQDMDPRFQRDPRGGPEEREDRDDRDYRDAREARDNRGRRDGDAGAGRQPPQWQRTGNPRVNLQAPVLREQPARGQPPAPAGRPEKRSNSPRKARPQPQQDDGQEQDNGGGGNDRGRR